MANIFFDVPIIAGDEKKDGRGRPAGLDTIAGRLLDGSCIQNANLSRVNAHGVAETVAVTKSMGKVKILNSVKSEGGAGEVVAARRYGNAPETYNGMPLQGYYDIGAEMVPFYGSEAAYQKLKGL